MRGLAAIALAGLAVAVAGCGGGASGHSAGTGPDSAATIAPADAPAFVAFDTDLSSGQWEAVDKLLDRFPARSQLLDAIRKQLGQQNLNYERDVKPALGSEIDFVWFDVGGGGQHVVGVTKPKDEGRFDALLAKGSRPTVHEVVNGWTVFSDKRSTVDAFRSAAGRAHLSDDPQFKEALAGLPDETLAKAYVDLQSINGFRAGLRSAGTALPGAGQAVWLSAALEATNGGIRLDGRYKSPDAPSNFKSTLLRHAPAGALLYVSFGGRKHALSSLRSNVSTKEYLSKLEDALGVSLDDLDPLLANEGELYVRAGTPLPEVTLAVAVDEEKKALDTFDTVVRKLAANTRTLARPDQSSGISGARELQLGPIALHYAAFDGKLVASTSAAGLSALHDGGARLEDETAFKEAAQAVGLPESNAGFIYVNLRDSVPLVESLSAFTGTASSAAVTGNLRPLRSVIAYAAKDGAIERFSAFLGID